MWVPTAAVNMSATNRAIQSLCRAGTIKEVILSAVNAADQISKPQEWSSTYKCCEEATDIP